MSTQRLTITLKLLTLVCALVTVGLARFGRPTALSSLGPSQDPLKGLWAVHALPLPPTEDHAWAVYTCTLFILLLPLLTAHSLLQPTFHPWIMESLLCMTGGVLYIICGSSLVNFYEPLLSSPSYPRSTGLALASFHTITGVLLIFNSLLVLCTQSRITVEGDFAGQRISKPAEVKITF